MLTTQTLLTYSIEGFLEPPEVAAINEEMDEFKRQLSAESKLAGPGNTLHSIKGLTGEQTVAVFEPAGRVEIDPLPDAAYKILDAAAARRLPDVQRALPLAASIGPWVYLEYGEAQFITPHADQYKNKDFPEHPKIAGISVQLNDDFTGGQLFVETCGSPDIWTTVEGELRVMRRMNNASELFMATPRTRWTATPAIGTGFIYGSQLVHGTSPVTSGRIRKVISWING